MSVHCGHCGALSVSYTIRVEEALAAARAQNEIDVRMMGEISAARDRIEAALVAERAKVERLLRLTTRIAKKSCLWKSGCSPAAPCYGCEARAALADTASEKEKS